jgi:hypothetical protein
MKTDNAASASSSARTSTTGHKRDDPSRKDDSKLSESEYLEKQAHDAQAAISQVLQDIKAKLGQGVDPRAWAREHPWVTIGAAAVAGFTATAALVPSKEEQALKKLAAIERALNAGREKVESNGDGKHAKGGGGGMLKAILLEAVGLLKPVLASVVAAQMGGQQAAQGEDSGAYRPGAYPPGQDPTGEQGSLGA